MAPDSARDVVEFWLGDSTRSPDLAAARRDWWYRGGAPADDAIRARFSALVRRACGRTLLHWQASADGALALVVLLDQFTRNLYRGTPEAYAGDALAFEIMQGAIAGSVDRDLHPVARIWLYHPLHHSERIDQQDRGLELLHDLERAAPGEWKPYVRRSIEGWGRHRDIVFRFGRFPHRNEVLGRPSTEEERAFLAEDGESFGQGPGAARSGRGPGGDAS